MGGPSYRRSTVAFLVACSVLVALKSSFTYSRRLRTCDQGEAFTWQTVLIILADDSRRVSSLIGNLRFPQPFEDSQRERLWLWASLGGVAYGFQVHYRQ